LRRWVWEAEKDSRAREGLTAAERKQVKAMEFVYVVFVINVFSHYIVGWRVSASARTGFVLDELALSTHYRHSVTNL
jgi:transposase InsO family protein